ncbi:uncharacterized protein [Elaeis guineensis]|uniref:Uncharacterized protein LOC105042625 isoform X1 n=1 Tax=Elaeis guineensis var. tenera TaxID=51953 RepID=A0A6I9R000_ELAGV|nr:uncharacterized protein LOC105042625 isoform X1 [Elaeis guineensis]
MELSPPSLRSSRESIGSSSLELQPFIDLDDRRSLQVQDEISALEQQQQLLYDCENERIRLQDEVRGLLEFVDNSGMRLQELEDGRNLNAALLRMCLWKNAEKERQRVPPLKNEAKTLTEDLGRYEAVERHQKEEMARLSALLESLQREDTSVSIKLQNANQEAEALSKEIENLEMQLSEESDCFLPSKKRNVSPASERDVNN